MRLRNIVVSGLVITGMSACQALAPGEAVNPAVQTPARYEHAAPVLATARQVDAQWILAFGDANLSEMVDMARTNNLDLVAGLANVRASQAALQSARSGLFPSVSASGSASADSADDFGSVGRNARLSASYQLDLFGETRAQVRAVKESLTQQLLDQRALELTVEQQVASGYVSVLALRAQLATAKDNLEIAQRIYQLVQVRYNAGAVSGYDLEGQKASLAASEARIPAIEQQLASAESALAILLGRPAQDWHAPDGDLMALRLPVTNPGMPSDLLLRRPDLLAAEAGLRAADANVDAARAAYFPSINLSAGLSSILQSGSDLLASVGASASQTVFSGGRLAAQTRSAQARRDALIASYRKAALNAFRDVDVALNQQSSSAAQETAYRTAESASKKALDLAEIRYKAGSSDLNSLLTAQSSYFSARNNVKQARADQLQAAIDLFVALGGGWQSSAAQ